MLCGRLFLLCSGGRLTLLGSGRLALTVLAVLGRQEQTEHATENQKDGFFHSAKSVCTLQGHESHQDLIDSDLTIFL